MVNKQKFRELILYIAEKSHGDRRFGAIKLNKILYYADFAAYRRLGAPITGDEYQHLSEGPAPRHLLEHRDYLIEDGSAELRFVPYANCVQQRLVPMRKPDVGLFHPDELAIVDEVIEDLRPLNARQLSDQSHEELGYRLTQDGETIPYRTAWLGCEPLTMEQIVKGWQLAREHGLGLAGPTQ